MPRAAAASVYDHGPTIIVGRGRDARVVPLREVRGEVGIADAGDPDAPSRTIRRAKRVWVPDVYLANGTIGQPQHDAAVRLHDSYAIGIMGVRERVSVFIAMSGSPAGMADAQLAAATDYRRAVQAVGIVSMAPISWCVLSYGTVKGWAECKGWGEEKAKGYLLSALDRLTEHYGYA